MERLPMIWFYCFALVITMKTSNAIDTMLSNQTLKDGETLVSKAEVFELGFFSLGNSYFRYLGIWYKQVPVLVWVANREVPGTDTTGVLKITDNGTLELHSVDNKILWSSFRFKPSTDLNPVAQLLDTGNLVIRDDISGDIIWQSFDACDRYGICGPYGSCINNGPACKCLEGFEPKVPEEWSVADWSNGCKRNTSTIDGNEFMKYTSMRLPDSRDSWFNISMSLEECRNLCDRNVSCTAYANIDVRGGGSGCLQWSTELLDIRETSDVDARGQDIYIKMSSLNLSRDKKKKSKKSYLIVAMSIVSAVVLLGFALILYGWRKKKKLHLKANNDRKQDSDLPLFSLSKVIKATSNFSINNKLGQGGFGAVYKGVLDEGVEIAVKRLSRTSRQGLAEFQNEVVCIAKLQHRNLVKLLGYCIQGEEMMLIYEYMPNKSLDSFLFDENNSLSLDWHQRFHIINGIARGLLYLHQDSRLRIIHRDLKASNILLDSNMNPKISDFGLARMFKEYETEANTNKVVGTLGYIYPEYAANGLFSMKSDIFSFGVLVLEIVSGKKNRGFSHQDHHDNLLGHAWRLFKEDNPLELVDTALGDSWIVSEVLQSVHVGLSCVQQHAEDRPSMSSVIHMLSGEGALPPPQPPGFFTQVPNPEIKPNLIIPEVLVSINEVTITQLDAR